MTFNAKTISQLQPKQICKCPGLNMWARGYNAGSKEKPIIKQAYYLKYRLDGVQQLRKIGIFAPKVVPGNKTKDLLTPAEAMALAENIVSEAKADNDYFAKEQVLDTTAGKALRERLKDFFEAALFDEAQICNHISGFLCVCREHVPRGPQAFQTCQACATLQTML